MGHMCPDHYREWRMLRQRNLLHDVDSHRLPLESGCVLVTCGDGDQIDDIFSFHGKACRPHRHDPRVHLVAFNGGPLIMDPLSPLRDEFPGAWNFVVYQIVASLILKRMTTLVLGPHGPCGQAGLLTINPLATLVATIRGKFEFKRLIRHEPDFLAKIIEKMDRKNRLTNDDYAFAKSLTEPNRLKVAVFPQVDYQVDYNGGGDPDCQGRRTYFLSGEQLKKFVGPGQFEF